ncbi:NAD-P-binding protein [Cyathus striatus]|nr:NAD-P-binding protein [Cyathus striatus]
MFQKYKTHPRFYGPALSFQHINDISSLTGKVAIVTGSSRSIGAAIVNKLAEEGAKVVVNYVSSPKSAERVVNAIKATGKGDAVAIKADASTLDGGRFLVDKTIKAFGKIDILVCNAGFVGNKTLAQEDEETFDKAINANFKGPLFLAKFAAQRLTARRQRLSDTVEPSTSKGFGTRRITVNAVSHGPVDTPTFGEGKTEEFIRASENLVPSKRLGQPDDIAPVVAFLASDGAKWVNGQNVRANGGFVV